MDRPWKDVKDAGIEERLALVSYLPLKRFRTVFSFLRLAGTITRQLERTPGLIGFTFRAKILSKKFYTLSVWEDERALMDFVRTPPHVDTMRALGPHMGETKFVRWTISGSEVPPTWDRALQVLAAP